MSNYLIIVSVDAEAELVYLVHDFYSKKRVFMGSLKIDGEVYSPREFGFAELLSLPDQVEDVSTIIPGRQGGAVSLRTLLDCTGVQRHVTHVTLHATDRGYSASLPLDKIIDRAVIVYRCGNQPLPTDQGGPMRFLIKDVDACGVSPIDACSTVKFLGRIELTQGPGVDTRRGVS